MAKRVAKIGVFIALAMVFSYIEVLVPISIGIPGVKLGLANLVIVVGLYLFKPQEVFLISIIRIMLVSVLFGNGAALIYSLSGGLLSFLVMYLCKRFDVFSIIGISIAGGVTHNIGQILAAAVILSNIKIATYLPVLLIAGLITGMVIGIVSKQIVKTMKVVECTI